MFDLVYKNKAYFDDDLQLYVIPFLRDCDCDTVYCFGVSNDDVFFDLLRKLQTSSFGLIDLVVCCKLIVPISLFYLSYYDEDFESYSW